MTNWLTVVTVVKDDPDGLRATSESLARQDLYGVEWTVIDSSRDRERTRALVDASGIACEYHWVTPTGIYPAMNEGLFAASGTYCYFLNAGDTLNGDDALSNLRLVTAEGDPEWLCCRVTVQASSGQEVVTPQWDFKAEKQRFFARGVFPPHQGTVAKTQLLRDAGGFDASYRIAADYALALRLSTVADPLMIDRSLATFREGGVSSVKGQDSFKEFHRARREVFLPTGSAAVREQLDTWVHFGKVWTYRTLIARR